MAGVEFRELQLFPVLAEELHFGRAGTALRRDLAPALASPVG